LLWVHRGGDERGAHVDGGAIADDLDDGGHAHIPPSLLAALEQVPLEDVGVAHELAAGGACLRPRQVELLAVALEVQLALSSATDAPSAAAFRAAPGPAGLVLGQLGGLVLQVELGLHLLLLPPAAGALPALQQDGLVVAGGGRP
jgi:hypothetical protein